MGEGWSDFNAMLLTVRADDTATPSNATFNGVYALATYATSGVPFNGSANQGYYFGIRRYPYSTDMTKNPLTFKHIANGVTLPVGPPLGVRCQRRLATPRSTTPARCGPRCCGSATRRCCATRSAHPAAHVPAGAGPDEVLPDRRRSR